RGGIKASTTAGPRKSVPPNTRTFFGVRASTLDVPASKRPREEAADVRINRLRFIASCDLHFRHFHVLIAQSSSAFQRFRFPLSAFRFEFSTQLFNFFKTQSLSPSRSIRCRFAPALTLACRQEFRATLKRSLRAWRCSHRDHRF